MKRDPYQVLGVERTAPKEKIRRAYRRRAQQHHPDRGGDPARMAEINQAYALLTDDSARERFDRTGEAGVAQSLEAQARAAAFSAMNQIIEEAPDQVNPIEALRQALGNARNQAKVQASTCRGRRNRLEKRLKRMRDGGFFAGLFAEKIGALERAIAGAEDKVAVCQAALELVANCAYDDDPEARQTIWLSFSGTGTGA